MAKDRFSATKNEPRKGFARLLGWFGRAMLIAVLLVFTVLLVWAFESRKLPTLGIWHTTSFWNRTFELVPKNICSRLG